MFLGPPNWSLDTQLQESIPVECVLPACVDHTCFNSHQMSALVGGVPEVNEIEQVSTDGHQMSLVARASEVPVH